MIYLDNAATSLQKPPAVAAAVAAAINTLGNAGRAAYPASMQAARTVFAARAGVAALAGLQNPLKVSFTSGVTESLNLVAAGLLQPGDGVITTALEHNSVLRPLFLAGCTVEVLEITDDGQLRLDLLPKLLKNNTKCVFCTHASNLLGSVADVATLYNFCCEKGLVLVLDAAQTFGQMDVHADMADILCFTGHKALLGPQGTGGIIMEADIPVAIRKTGGTGSQSFAPLQQAAMPDLFEAGTANSHGLAGLLAGVAFVRKTGVAHIAQHEAALTAQFLQGVAGVPGITVYGPKQGPRAPVVALNVGQLSAEDTALRLFEEYGIATRPGSHCAPLVHRHFGTEKRGMVRFSFGYFNTPAEVETTLQALRTMAKGT